MEYELGYMPHIEGNYDSGLTYTPMAIVTNNGYTYISKVNVAAGMEPGVTSGWGNYWHQICEPGTQGAAGMNGTNGAQGAAGMNGTNGTNGAQGVQGVQGNKGKDAMEDFISYLDNNLPGVVMKPGMVALVFDPAADFKIDFAIEHTGDMTKRPSRLIIYFPNYTIVRGYSSSSGQPVRINKEASDYFTGNKIKPGWYVFDFVEDEYVFIIHSLIQDLNTIQPY